MYQHCGGRYSGHIIWFITFSPQYAVVAQWYFSRGLERVNRHRRRMKVVYWTDK